MKIICDEFPIPCFPFKDNDKLRTMAKDWQRRGTGGLFTSCVGAFDGCLLRISKSCVHGDKVTNPQKYWCRKGFYAVNCQVCCDAHRRGTWMSLSHPGDEVKTPPALRRSQSFAITRSLSLSLNGKHGIGNSSQIIFMVRYKFF